MMVCFLFTRVKEHLLEPRLGEGIFTREALGAPSFDVVPCVTQLQRSLFRFELRSRSLPEFSSHRINKTIMAFLTCNVSRNLIAFQLGNDRL